MKKLEVGDAINGLEIIKIGYVNTEFSTYVAATVKCSVCGKEFEKSLAAMERGKAKCVCQGGYRQLKKTEHK